MKYTVKTYLDQPFIYKGKTLYADCYLTAYPDGDSIEGSFDFGNEAENAEYLARFESGELQSVNLECGIYTHSHVVTCELEQGGCDKDFVLDVSLDPRSSVRTIAPISEALNCRKEEN